jgi:hypothetical protein
MESAPWPSLSAGTAWSRTGSFQSAASIDFDDVEDLRSFFDAAGDDARTPRQAVLRIRTEVGSGSNLSSPQLPARELREQEVAAAETSITGERTYPDGSVYAGQLLGDDRHGQGRCIYPAGPAGCDVYDGSWADDRANGNGVYTSCHGARYSGQWSDDHRHGIGSESYADGSSFHGRYELGVKHGEGRMVWADGAVYTGVFEADAFHGHGELKTADGNHYVGGWRNGKMHGHGRYAWADGRVYEGEYAEDRRHGEGRFEWPDGREYHGPWKEGKPCGIATSSSKLWEPPPKKSGWAGPWLPLTVAVVAALGSVISARGRFGIK